jgi:peptide-methionine (S)-S-oxide reductase
VVRTRVGYAGGRTKNPTYYSIGDHTETLQIDYDPTQITYAALLDIFWKTHNGCGSQGSRQYMTAVFYENEEQKTLAEETRDREAARRGAPITTAILPATEFTVAEDYHQKYHLRHQAPLLRDFRRMYPSDADFMNSTAAARINGYLGGYGSRATFEKERAAYGLSPEGLQTLTTLLPRAR